MAFSRHVESRLTTGTGAGSLSRARLFSKSEYFAMIPSAGCSIDLDTIISRELILADLIQVGKHMAEALVSVQKYVQAHTGTRATDTEIANSLKSYFIMNEIGNLIRYQRKKPPSRVTGGPEPQPGPLWTMNLMDGELKSNISKAGLFPQCIQEGIQATSDFVEKATGQRASLEEIASSLTSSLLLSEIKSQIDWQRKNPEETDPSSTDR
jgi:hypothetical protein